VRSSCLGRVAPSGRSSAGTIGGAWRDLHHNDDVVADAQFFSDVRNPRGFAVAFKVQHAVPPNQQFVDRHLVTTDGSPFGYGFFPGVVALVTWTIATSIAGYRAASATAADIDGDVT
jgi:hypothetical protein